MPTGQPYRGGQALESVEHRSGSNISEGDARFEPLEAQSSRFEAHRSIDQEAADDTIARRILEGTWTGQGQVGPEEAMVTSSEGVERRSFDKGVVRGGNWQPCSSCGQEFYNGDIVYQQAFPFHGKKQRLCSSCFHERYTQRSPSMSRDRSFDSNAELPDVEIRPLHNDPRLSWLASQGGRMSDIRQHIQDEMHRLLGPEEAAPSQPQPQDSAAALYPTTPRQLARGRPVSEPYRPDSKFGGAVPIRDDRFDGNTATRRTP